MKHIFQERARQLAKETGAVVRVRQFDGASLLQTLVFGFQQHPAASLEQLASMATLSSVKVTDSTVHKRFGANCAQFLHPILEELTTVLVQAKREGPMPLLKRFAVVMLEDSSRISLPDELAPGWRGCAGNQSHTATAVKGQVRWELVRGELQGPKLSDGRTSDHGSPFHEVAAVAGSLYVEDLGYVALDRLAARQRAGAYSLTRYRVGTALSQPKGQ